ncbi:MAG: ComEC/Rec2 family competence protein [Pseudomonadota bacterium]
MARDNQQIGTGSEPSHGAVVDGSGPTVAREQKRAPPRRLGRNPDIPRFRRLARGDVGWRLRDILIDQQDRLFLWVPVLLACGAALWLAAPREPQAWALFSLAAVSTGLAVWLRRSVVTAAVASTIAIMAFGGFSIGLQAEYGGGPAVAERTPPLDIAATVAKIEHRPGRQLRLTLRRVSIPQAIAGSVPHRLRITLRRTQHEGVGIVPGARIQLRAILLPLPDAAMAGGYDFSRRAYFEGLGGLGFALSAPRVLAQPAAKAGMATAFRAAIDTVRLNIRERIHASLSGAQAAVASALIVGHRSDMPDEVRETLRIAGLAHILAISGLHMALLAGGVFYGVRAGLALIQPLALRVSPKKIAAIAGLAAALVYLFLSGATVATQRAFVMAAIVFAAMLLDRPALTLRAVALAALLIILIDPKAATQAGFQMSFAATAALVAVYEVLRRRREQFYGASPLWRSGWLWPVRLVSGLAITSLVAGAATGPIAAFHFNHTAVYGLIGNVMAMPVMTFATMPMAALSLVLMPLGLEPLALGLMGQSIELIIGISEWVQHLPRSDIVIPAMPGMVLPLMLLSGCWLIIVTHPVRFLGIAGFVLAVILVLGARPPDVLISRDGRMAAIVSTKDGHRHLAPIATSRSAFTLDNWLRRIGDRRAEADPSLTNVRCGEADCSLKGSIATGVGSIRVAIERYGDDIAALCVQHDIVVLPSHSPRGNPIPVRAGRNRNQQACADTLVIERSTLLNRGALSIWIDEKTVAPGSQSAVVAEQIWNIRGARDHSRHRRWSVANRSALTLRPTQP